MAVNCFPVEEMHMLVKRTSTDSRCRGFTLIELLVVVSIIALLVSILLPALSKAREQARRVMCSTRLKQLHLGLSYYAHDFEMYPATRPGSPWSSGWGNAGWPAGALNLSQGLSTIAPFFVGKFTPGAWQNDTIDAWDAQIRHNFMCPAAEYEPDQEAEGSSRGDFNYFYLGWAETGWYGIVGEQVRSMESPTPASSLLIKDKTENLVFPLHEAGWEVNHSKGVLQGGNGLYNDGHASWHQPEGMTPFLWNADHGEQFETWW
jgi:prepilin-type N-terminal cleavage/methylation domain-containing protein